MSSAKGRLEGLRHAGTVVGPDLFQVLFNDFRWDIGSIDCQGERAFSKDALGSSGRLGKLKAGAQLLKDRVQVGCGAVPAS